MPAAKVREQRRAQVLRAKGQSLNEIARKMDVSKGSISLWVRDVTLTKTAQRILAERIVRGSAKGRRKTLAKWKEYRLRHPKPLPNLNRIRIREFFNVWTPASAYVLGFFAADGCMYHSSNGGHSTGGLYIAFGSADRELIETIKEIMQIRNKIEIDDRSSTGHKPKYLLRIVNKTAYSQFLRLGFMPSKSLVLRFPDVPGNILEHFVRGYFDGDGCVYHYKAKNGKQSLLTSFTSGSRLFLERLKECLASRAGVIGGSLFQRGENHFVLQYSTRDSRQLYKFMYPTPTVPHLERKKRKFEEALAVLGP